MAKIFVIDIDGTLSEDIQNERPELMPDAKEIPGAREWLNARYGEGHYICLFTARTQDLEQVTRDWLEKHGMKYHTIIFGKPRKLGYDGYHYIDNSRVQATTLKQEFTNLRKVQREIEVFD
jgi:uncharacterized HAD superfamily protein